MSAVEPWQAAPSPWSAPEPEPMPEALVLPPRAGRQSKPMDPTPHSSGNGDWMARWRHVETGNLTTLRCGTEDEARRQCIEGFNAWVRAGSPSKKVRADKVARRKIGRPTSPSSAPSIDEDGPRPVVQLDDGQFRASYRSLPSGTHSKRQFKVRAEAEKFVQERWRLWDEAGRPGRVEIKPGKRATLEESSTHELPALQPSLPRLGEALIVSGMFLDENGSVTVTLRGVERTWLAVVSGSTG